MNDLQKKLRIKEGQRVLVLNAPEEYIAQLGDMPTGTTLDTSPVVNEKYDFVQLFVHSISELESYAPQAMQAVVYDGILWFSYPKKTSKIKTDINRDAGWTIVMDGGFEGISSVSIDETWSSIRFRPREKVNVTTDRIQRREARREQIEKGAPVKKGDPERVVSVPDDLAVVLQEHQEVLSFFEGLSYSNRKAYVTWIEDAKRAETRVSRIEKTLEKMKAGKKNPSEK